MVGGQTGKARYLLCVMLLSASLVACGKQTVEELPLENYTPEEIYKRGEFLLEGEGKPKDALIYFQEVERLYPYSEWAKRGLIMQTYALHQAKNYEEARASAQRYLDFYPGEEDAAYAAYLLALSYYDQIDEVGRDQGLTFQALQAFLRMYVCPFFLPLK